MFSWWKKKTKKNVKPRWVGVFFSVKPGFFFLPLIKVRCFSTITLLLYLCDKNSNLYYYIIRTKKYDIQNIGEVLEIYLWTCRWRSCQYRLCSSSRWAPCPSSRGSKWRCTPFLLLKLNMILLIQVFKLVITIHEPIIMLFTMIVTIVGNGHEYLEVDICYRLRSTHCSRFSNSAKSPYFFYVKCKLYMSNKNLQTFP